MKKTETAHFDLVKQQNKKLVRNFLREEESQSISVIADSTKLSYPTAAALLKELEAAGEVEKLTETKTCGGRPGVAYRINAAHRFALLLIFKDWSILGSVYDYTGKKCGDYCFPVTREVTVKEILAMIIQIREAYSGIHDVAIGIPGVTKDTDICFLPKFPKLEGAELAAKLQKEGIAVFVENDLNAIAFARAGKGSSFVHIACVEGCIGTGIVLEGELLKGEHGYAGELEELCLGITGADERIARAVQILHCVLDISTYYISVDNETKDLFSSVQQILKKKISKERMPVLIHVENPWESYETGLLRRIEEQWKEELYYSE